MLFILLAGMTAYVSIEAGVGFFADAIFVTEYSNTVLGAYAISAFWLAMTLTRFVFAIVKVKMQKAVLAGFTATSVLLLLMLFFRYQWIQLGIIVLLGAALGPIWPMIVGIGTSSFREKSGTVGSILYAAGGVGGIVTPVLIGWASERASFYGGFWLLAAVSAIGFFTALPGLRRR
jgi:fucose permease